MSEKPIGVYSLGLYGVVVYDIKEETVLYKFSSGDKTGKLHKAKIKYNTKGAYFETMLCRIYFSEVLRINN